MYNFQLTIQFTALLFDPIIFAKKLIAHYKTSEKVDQNLEKRKNTHTRGNFLGTNQECI